MSEKLKKSDAVGDLLCVCFSLLSDGYRHPVFTWNLCDLCTVCAEQSMDQSGTIAVKRLSEAHLKHMGFTVSASNFCQLLHIICDFCLITATGKNTGLNLWRH